jgi:Delta24-sterol reductase
MYVLFVCFLQRSVFWEIEYLIPFSNKAWYRYLFGWLGAPKISLLKATMTKEIRQRVINKHIVQDIIVPLSVMSETVDLFHDLFEVYPLLCFPIAMFDHGECHGMMRKPKELLPGRNYQMFFDLGAYGVPAAVLRKEPWNGIENVRKMESFARSVNGYQLLYADTFMTRSEFKEMFDHTLYDNVRRKYKAEGAFPEVYDKIVPECTVALH